VLLRAHKELCAAVAWCFGTCEHKPVEQAWKALGSLQVFAFVGWGEALHALALGCTPFIAGPPFALAGLLDLLLQVRQRQYTLCCSFVGAAPIVC
jgi:hypothetical protein